MPTQCICEQCAKTFPLKPSKVSQGRGRFCSMACNRTWNTPENRFWRNIDISGGPDACWPWTASCNQSGYGHFDIDGQSIQTHRYAYARIHGPITPSTLVLHTCDNPPCANDRHLFSGNHLVNTHDMILKGRAKYAKGEQQGSSKLTQAQIIEARSLQGVLSQRAIAKRLSTTQANIWLILRRRAWAHIP